MVLTQFFSSSKRVLGEGSNFMFSLPMMIVTSFNVHGMAYTEVMQFGMGKTFKQRKSRTRIPDTLLETRIALWVTNFSVRFFGTNRKICN
jgi:hypothetical protein